MADRLSIPIRWLVAGTLAGITLGSVGIAAAQTDESTTTTAPSSSSTAPSSPDASSAPADRPKQRADKTPLTGETADKVKAAALAAVPGGTVERTMEGRDGRYVALVTKADGTRVAVKLDDAFAVTSIEEGGGRCHHRGPGGRHRHPRPPAADGDSQPDGSTGTATNA